MSNITALQLAGMLCAPLCLSTQTVVADDSIKVMVYNGSSSMINRLKLYVGTTLVDTNKKNLASGQTNQVNWEVGENKNWGDLHFEYAVVASTQYDRCSKSIQTKSGSPAGQLSSVKLADGRVYNLDNAVDEVITVRYKVTGNKNNRKCEFDGVRKRLR